MSRFSNVVNSLLNSNSSSNELVPAIKNENDMSVLARQVSKRDVDKALENKAKKFNGKQYVSGMDSSVLGSYSSDGTVEANSDDILSRLVVEQSTHLSNWKNDSLVGNGNDKVSFTINIMPTWDSRRKYMHISRLIVWIVPTAPDSESLLKATLIDQNEMTADKKIIVSKQSSLLDPVCFIFHLNWSFPKERNTPKQCFQLNLTSNKKYAKGASFAAVMYSWVKNFCDTPIAAEKNTCDVIPINRAKVIKSAALIEACRLMIPKGTSGKQISNQIKRLKTVAEKLALEAEASDNEEELDIKLDLDNRLDL
ncbi:Nsm [Tospovirus kiwifruit/YXW/2014]|uniref:Nsm n=1 Tax=Tospovirus kiwifruit/YXW/2014 TaxID=1857323 RepID=UPI0007E914CA|nr:Nsm [Tospovirus kiwifruit/YXW/2014]ANJ02897.1 Nsm [Tospovirus kiwifruit/YXW/2014]